MAGGSVTGQNFVGGLLGHWAVWTKRAVELLEECRSITTRSVSEDEPRAHSILAHASGSDLFRTAIEITDCNAAFFDATNHFAGCIAGLHEVLRRQRLMEGIWCLDEHESLSPGQMQEIDRVYAAYPALNDDAFVEAHRDDWMR